MAGAIQLEQGTAADLPEVMDLATADPNLPQWPLQAWEAYVGTEADSSGHHRVLLLARDNDRHLVGWLVASGFEETVELELLLVRADSRLQGIGRLLVERWLTWARDRGALSAVLEVRVSNTAAIRLYRSLGFETQGVRRGYYRHPPEDAVFMSISLQGTLVPAEGQPPEPGLKQV